jgi:hypothetical protein
MNPPGARHHTTLHLSEPVPPEIEAGTRIALKINVSCARGCDLRGKHVHIVASDDVVASGALVHHDGPLNETEAIALTVPQEIGDHAWAVRFSPDEADSDPHEADPIPLCFTTIPHTLSMAVWDVPSPVAIARTFHVKVGVRCSAACHLPGRLVEVIDNDGTKVGEGRLGETPWPGTTGLFWTAIELAAPATAGVFVRSVALVSHETELPHEGVPATFSFRVDKAPEHSVTVKVVEGKTGAGVPDVEVRFGQYTASTDEGGVARMALPEGTFEVTIRKDGLQAEPLIVPVNGNMAVDIEAVTVPTRAELDARIFDDYPWG